MGAARGRDAVAGRDPVWIHRTGPELSVLREKEKKKKQGPWVTRPDSVAGRKDAWTAANSESQMPGRGCRPLAERWGSGQG